MLSAPRKIHACFAGACFFEIFVLPPLTGLIAGGITGTGYSLYKYFDPISSEHIIKPAQELIDHLTIKYQDALNLDTNNELKDLDSEYKKQIKKVIIQEDLTKKEYIRMLCKDLRELQTKIKQINRYKNKIDRGMKKNRYVYLASYQEITSLVQDAKDMLDKLRKLQSCVKQIDLS